MSTLPVIFEGKQFDRVGKLFLGSNQNTVLDLSDFHFRFNVESADFESPNTAIIRVYNIGQALVTSIITEYSSVVLQAGYPGNNAVIFQGTVKQYKRGRESNVDSFIEILAASDDLPYNYSQPVSNTVSNPTSQSQVLDYLSKQMGVKVDQTSLNNVTANSGVLPRGKVLFGLPKAYIRDMAVTLNSSWSLQNGAITITPIDGYIPGQIVQLNSATGLIGVPEVTDNGIVLRCLINPRIFIGGLVELNNKELNDTTLLSRYGFPSFASQAFIASLSPDGRYRVLTMSHAGDTRGQEWYTTLICLRLDISSGKVQNY